MSRKVDNLSRWLYIKLDPYMNNTQPYTQIVHKHSMFYTGIHTCSAPVQPHQNTLTLPNDWSHSLLIPHEVTLNRVLIEPL